ncbi:MAG: DUF402 domain-containing protein [Anaerolineae bacterium]|nr:MAG: hypothetical protein UZ13_00035 [Chloroflexi bacterium OLB13]MBC6956386.1 DUF402 domain-containing protein [Chloroflexota bacterium]MBW7879919.1 DUF402 domain-containing protein [Anaerolineae bacterium]MDL1916558.1 DUF402 domain-containing protein [Anaerolineae bacterium CFX4]MCO6444125.1 DUF402 domain-containing protein [Anaerolineae bacterium]
MTRARIEKRDHAGVYVWHYFGDVIEQSDSHVVIESRMGRDILTAYVHFRQGDRMVETFYADRWYNIFEMHDVDDDRLKGWYCNICRPAHLTSADDTLLIQYDDLALDAFVDPFGNLLVLDEDELDALHLSVPLTAAVWRGMEALTDHVARRLIPFHGVMRRTNG